MNRENNIDIDDYDDIQPSDIIVFDVEDDYDDSDDLSEEE